MLRMLCGCLLLLCCGLISVGFASPSPENDAHIKMEKTFDSEALDEYTLTATLQDQRVVAIYRQRRTVQGSNQVESAGLSYRPHKSGHKALTQKSQQALLGAIIKHLESKFKNDLKLTYLISSGYLNAIEPIRQNLLAFHRYKPWIKYIDAPAPHQIPQYKTHAMVVRRWKERGVYAGIIALFNTLGYDLKLEGFEKLFVQRADKFVGFELWKPEGILPHERFPYPGSIQFSVRKKGNRINTK